MSTLKVNTIQHSNGTNAMTIDSSGNAAFSGVVTGTPLGNRNLIINGDMRIAQRGTSSTGITTSGYYTVDRWKHTGAAGTWTQSQDTDVPSGQGFSNSIKLDCTTAKSSLVAGDYLVLAQAIEGQNLQHLKYGTANVESLTVSFWVKSNKTGTYIFELYKSSAQISKSYTIDIADTWEKKTIIFDGDIINSIANNSGGGLIPQFWLSVGTDFSSGTLQTSWGNTTANRAVGQVNLADSTSNYINITGVQLEVGDVATPFEHRPYDMELARCQRYYELINDNNYSSYGVMAGGTSQFFAGYVDYKITKRATPTITITGSFLIQGNSNQPGTTSMGTSGIGKRAVYINGTGTGSNVTNGFAYNLLDVNGYIKVDAEL